MWGGRQEGPGISWHHPHPQKVRKPLSRALMNALQKKLPGFRPVALAPAGRNQPSLEAPFLPMRSSTPSLSLCLPGAMTRGFTGWPRSWWCGGCWPSAAGSVTGGSAGSGRPSASPTSTASGKGSRHPSPNISGAKELQRRRDDSRGVIVEQGEAASLPSPLSLFSVATDAAPRAGPSPRI